VLTEIQQMAVDYFRQDYYEGGILPKFRQWGECEHLFDEKEPVSIQTLPDVSSNDLLEEIENCTSALQRNGFEPLVINISHPVLEIPAVFVLMVGSELYEMSVRRLNVPYFLARRLKFIGRLKEAMDMFSLSMNTYPESILHGTVGIADCLKRLQRWDEALENYKQACFHQPDRAMQMQIFRSMAVCTEKLKENRQKSKVLRAESR
jgi:ribosomal protein S12 methylthiotransferase accessory factor